MNSSNLLNRFTLITLLLSYCCLSSLNAQVFLDNPSFEGEAQDATMPMGWLGCEEGSTPDILPGHWGVYSEPSEGETFMGLIARDNGEWESVGQRLSGPLKNAMCYTFSVDLAHSNTYSGYNEPLKLRIWGSKTRCAKDQLLAESKVVRHSNWITYEFYINPKLTVNYIILEAFFDGNHPQKGHRGNILIDNCSEFEVCDRASL